MGMASSTWACDRAAYLKSIIPSGSSILIGSGGGITTELSLGGWATTCASFDIISVHDYGTNAQNTANALTAAKSGSASGKIVMMGEWGITGANKASTIAAFVNAFKAAGLPWMYWEVVKPGKASSDFEVSSLFVPIAFSGQQLTPDLFPVGLDRRAFLGSSHRRRV